MTLKEALARLKALVTEKMRAQNKKRGADDNQFGVLMGDIRKVAAEIKTVTSSYIVKNHPDKESLRGKWMSTDDPWAARAGWNLTAARIGRSSDGIDLPALLDRIESEMPGADHAVQWTMNSCLAVIGIHHPKHRRRAIALGESMGIYRDYPVSKGCTSPFAPIWIAEMVRRQDWA